MTAVLTPADFGRHPPRPPRQGLGSASASHSDRNNAQRYATWQRTLTVLDEAAEWNGYGNCCCTALWILCRGHSWISGSCRCEEEEDDDDEEGEGEEGKEGEEEGGGRGGGGGGRGGGRGGRNGRERGRRREVVVVEEEEGPSSSAPSPSLRGAPLPASVSACARGYTCHDGQMRNVSMLQGLHHSEQVLPGGGGGGGGQHSREH